MLIMVFLLLLPSVCWGEGKKIGLSWLPGIRDKSFNDILRRLYEPVKN